MTITGKPVTTLPEAGSVTNDDFILVFSNGALMRAAGTLFRGDPGADATINGENVLTLEAGDNIELSQSGGTLTLSANISGVFIFKGPATLATLPALTAANLGFTYNMTQAFTTTADFIEGAGKEYSAGADVAVCDAGNGVYKYNVLSVDLSGLVPETRKINGHALSADVTLTKSDVGLGNADNTSDTDKPISAAQRAALDLKVDKVSGKGLSTNDYTTAEKNAVATIGDKVDKVTGKGLSTNDYTTAEKDKLSGIAAGANHTTIDATLSNDGQAADAKAAGDAIAALEAQNALLRELIDGIDAPIYRTASGNPVVFSDGAAANVKDLRVTITPTQSGSGEPSPTNVRPIVGVSSATVTRTGKNLLKISASSATTGGVAFTVDKAAGTVTANGTANEPIYFRVNAFSYKDGVSYIISGCPAGGSASAYYVYNGNLGNGFVDYGNGSPAKDGATIDKARGQYCYIFIQQGYACSNLVFRPMIRFADTDATFELYRGQSVAVTLTDGANPLTVYGGRLELSETAATLTVTHGNIASYNGETVPDGWISSTGQLSTGAQVVYPLATPQTYQLAPAQLATLAGYNTVSANVGSVSVTYRSDPEIALGGG